MSVICIVCISTPRCKAFATILRRTSASLPGSSRKYITIQNCLVDGESHPVFATFLFLHLILFSLHEHEGRQGLYANVYYYEIRVTVLLPRNCKVFVNDYLFSWLPILFIALCISFKHRLSCNRPQRLLMQIYYRACSFGPLPV